MINNGNACGSFGSQMGFQFMAMDMRLNGGVLHEMLFDTNELRVEKIRYNLDLS